MENLATKQPAATHLNAQAAEQIVPLQAPAKLDLSRISPPEDLDSANVESLTIDGICGVY